MERQARNREDWRKEFPQWPNGLDRLHDSRKDKNTV